MLSGISYRSKVIIPFADTLLLFRLVFLPRGSFSFYCPSSLVFLSHNNYVIMDDGSRHWKIYYDFPYFN